jgi:hypothetical protein
MKNKLVKQFTIIALIAASTMLSACEGDQPTKVTAMQNKDKVLNCDDILLEINESEFYRKEAEKSKSLGVKTVIAPIGYLDTYMNAGDAVAAADARISYLNRIYEIRKCSRDQQPSAYVPSQQQGQAVNNVPVVQGNPYQQPFGAAGSYTGAPQGQIQLQVPNQQAPQLQYQQAQPQYQYPQR